jgi:hypothetical protein
VHSLPQLKVDLEAALDDMASTLAVMRREQSLPPVFQVSASAVADYERARARWLSAMEALRACEDLTAAAELSIGLGDEPTQRPCHRD